VNGSKHTGQQDSALMALDWTATSCDRYRSWLRADTVLLMGTSLDGEDRGCFAPEKCGLSIARVQDFHLSR